MKVGERVGDYVVEAELGAGGMATVYRVRHVVLDSVHALKALNDRYRASPEVRRRFLDEARIQAKHLLHPNIVRVTNIVATDTVAALVMDHVEGGALDDYVAGLNRRLSEEELKSIALPVLDAIGHAHEAGIIHRDLKPANILVRQQSGRVVPLVTDFGIAKLRSPDSEGSRKASTHHDAKMGTVGYSSPEQIVSAKGVTARSDIFSLGAVFYEIATGRPAFSGRSDFEIMDRIVHGHLEPAAQYAARTLSLHVATALIRALDPDPTNRYATCHDFARALVEAEAVTERRHDTGPRIGNPRRHEGKLDDTPAAVKAPPRPSHTDGTTRRLLAFLVAAAIVATVVVFVVHSKDERPKNGRASGHPEVAGGKTPTPSIPFAESVRSSFREFADQFTLAMLDGDERVLSGMLSPTVLGIGPRVEDVATNAGAAASMIVSRTPRSVGATPTDAANAGVQLYSEEGSDQASSWFDVQLRGGGPNPPVIRLSAVAQLTSSGWRIDALHLSRAISVAEERALLARGNPPAGLRVAATAPSSTATLLQYVTATLENADAFEAAISDDASFTMYGSAPAERYVGGAAAKRAFRSWKLSMRHEGPLHAGIAGTVGWTATTIAVDYPNRTTLYRGLFVFRRGADGWKMVQAHFSTNVR